MPGSLRDSGVSTWAAHFRTYSPVLLRLLIHLSYATELQLASGRETDQGARAFIAHSPSFGRGTSLSRAKTRCGEVASSLPAGGDCAGQTEERPRVPPAAQGCPLQPSRLPEQVVPGRDAAAFPLGSTGPEAAPSARMESVPTGQSQLVKLT